MVKFINKHTGSVMWVADDRKEEYIEAGHALASAPKAEEPEKKPAKRTKKS